MFTVLPFGLCSEQFIFTKVMCSLVKFWKRGGIKICVYIDDGLGTSPSLDLTLEEAKFVRNSLTQCGLTINSEKVSLATTKRTYLAGNKDDLINSSFTISENRIL